MTPKEKAKELFDGYYYCLLQSNIEKRNYWSKQCALIAVEFSREFITGDLSERFDKTMYLLEVKEELEKL
jgi:hypothetical protein